MRESLLPSSIVDTDLSTVYQEGFAQLHEFQPFMMLHVNLFSTLDVTFIAKAINTIYEANVQQSETEIFKLRITSYYSLGKNF
jgi:hypothetical protein